MKNSIGSLAALAAFAIPAVLDAATQVAAFDNVTLPYENSGSVDFDLDGDGTQDFYVFSNSIFVGLEAYGDNLFTSGPVTYGSFISTADPNTSFLLLEEVDTPPSFGTGYLGLTFMTGGQPHIGWILLDYSGVPKLAVSGAWESDAGQSISVGAIPEPATTAALSGAGALILALGMRRRRQSALPS